MNLKFKIVLAAALILAAVFAIFSWPAGKSAEAAPATILPAAPPPARPATVALSVAPPPPAVVTAATPAGDPQAEIDTTADDIADDPQAEIGTAVDDIISLLKSSEILAFYEKYTAPEKKAKWSDAQREEYAQVDALAKANPAAASADGRIESLIGGFESIYGQTPQMNDGGDEATFQFTMMPPPELNLPPRVSPLVMVKVNGKWYLKSW